MIDRELYHEFRNTVDELAFADIKASSNFVEVMDGNKVVGFLLVHDGYIEGAYVREDHRRKGLMRNAVKNYVSRYGLPNDLHIVNRNKVAYAFWSSIFNLGILDVNRVDTHYAILGMKE